MNNANGLSRRGFFGAGAAGAAAPYFVSAGAFGANDKINVGVIGVGPQGRWNLGELLKQSEVCTVVGICDVWKERRDSALEACKGSAKPYTDFREMLAQKDIDAVLIATPPHWHTLMTIAACEADKDFYCEKPMTMHLGESLAILHAVDKHKRITQIGTQIHAGANYRRVVEYVRSGNLGPISLVRAFCLDNQGPQGIGHTPESDPPPGLDWEMWLGPAPKRRFHPVLAKSAYWHSSWMDYSGGWIPGMAPHIIDLPYWALQLNYPTMVSASGGRYIIRDDGDCPDTHNVFWTYPNFTMAYSMSLVNSYAFDFQGKGGIARRLAICFHGVNGTLMTDYGNHKIVPEGDRMKDAKTPEKSIPDSVGHHREWLDGIRTRKQPLCHVGYHHKVDTASVLANLALKLGRSIKLDPKTAAILDDAEAAKMTVPTYREPWKFPKEYL